jgi:hypothetical protein
LRRTIEITGRRRKVSWIVAVKYSSRPSSTSARRRSSLWGLRLSRSIAQESEVAVVSWPATSKVSSSSRISSSRIGLPSS